MEWDEIHAIKEYLRWAGVKHDPTQSADNLEANDLAEAGYLVEQ